VLSALRVVSTVAVLTIAACTSPDSVVTHRAAADLACPPRELTVSCTGGIVFHMAEQFRCEAKGCGKAGEYRCETPLRNVGPFEVRRGAVCE
jgi:hypothetical protein